MKWSSFISICLWLAMISMSPLAKGESPPAFHISFHGFIHPEFIFDSRQFVSAREGNVVLYPMPRRPDAEGKDLNAVPSATFSLLSSRFGAAISGPELFGARTSGLLEIDFLGSRAETYNLIRMRHALVRLNWETTELLAGQYWHPMFVTSCFPGVISLGAGAPYHTLNRGPQIRLTKKISTLSLSAAMISQNDYVSLGPLGGSSTYIRNSGKPGFYGQVIHEQGKFLAGFTAGYKWLRPKTSTRTGYQTTENIGSFSGNVFARWQHNNTSIKVQTIYGEEMSSLVMLGGYGEAERIDTLRNIYNYSGLRTMSAWIDISQKVGSFYVAIFAGYSRNLGSKTPITGEFWARGSNISEMYRISPRAGLVYGRTTLNLEFLYNVAAYGTPDESFQFTETDPVTGIRTLVSLKYVF
jgi:hypothetical protein